MSAPSALARLLAISLLLSVLPSPAAALQAVDTGSPATAALLSTTLPARPGENVQLPPERQGSIRSVRPEGGRKVVAFTFDLCETEAEVYGYDAAVVDCLRSSRVRATFFAGGKYMKTHPKELIELMTDPLFEVGNHSWSHKNFRLLGPEEMEEQVMRTQRQYGLLRSRLPAALHHDLQTGDVPERIPEFPRLFRFPFGTCTPQALNLLNQLGLAAIQWSIVSGDPDRNRTPVGIVRTVLAEMKPGAIVIFHANGLGHGTAEAIHILIPKLRADGYEFLTVSELLDTGTPVVSSECYELRPGDNLQYDGKPERGRHAGN